MCSQNTGKIAKGYTFLTQLQKIRDELQKKLPVIRI